VLRASSYDIPAEVTPAVSGIFGLHGLPLPEVQSGGEPSTIANVTPGVIHDVYHVTGVEAKRPSTVRQAVAEFQGETMNTTNLQTFFQKYVQGYQTGDDAVSKFVGDLGAGKAQDEGNLDIQYIMGVAPGIQTEYWLYNSMDFCGDLKNWTTQLLASDDIPLVHSVSYGSQGNLSQMGCQEAEVKTIDDDFAKLATRGISIIVASGDSGSGYSAFTSDCFGSSVHSDMQLAGQVHSTSQTVDYSGCCSLAVNANQPGFTWEPPAHPSPPFSCPASGATGIINNGSTWGGLSDPGLTAEHCCQLSVSGGHVGWSFFTGVSSMCPTPNCCVIYSEVTGNATFETAQSGTNPRKAAGTCTIFSSLTGNKTLIGATSGGPAFATSATLYASWPASSPWVTAVGATRFEGQKVGAAEMATDYFGSGGGFATPAMLPDGDEHWQSWQATAVASYVENVPRGAHWPPAGSFDAKARATPDVAALGEGFQITYGDHITAIGGTSASAPLFAALVSLLNEARRQKGHHPMGFLNPFLYQNTDAFTDITVGTNAIGRGGASGAQQLKYGFNCTTGWDPVTGLGTPRFDKLLKAALAVPALVV
jgi:hypothetical protein